ncbi:hypothetical protein Pmani_019940 [Petrolisthes manimaculis]|uniref:Uncharacterized protein n=1 Tax=Petrolisthes manimaculis TaxID=1843537 RepID=A0AAE1PHX3_9EUCA|nr:hypothetical protein Pmani_019940 [Petrolisthes manimaculis]
MPACLALLAPCQSFASPYHNPLSPYVLPLPHPPQPPRSPPQASLCSRAGYSPKRKLCCYVSSGQAGHVSLPGMRPTSPARPSIVPSGPPLSPPLSPTLPESLSLTHPSTSSHRTGPPPFTASHDAANFRKAAAGKITATPVRNLPHYINTISE